jgi:hypothetical protein
MRKYSQNILSAYLYTFKAVIWSGKIDTEGLRRVDSRPLGRIKRAWRLLRSGARSQLPTERTETQTYREPSYWKLEGGI